MKQKDSIYKRKEKDWQKNAFFGAFNGYDTDTGKSNDSISS